MAGGPVAELRLRPCPPSHEEAQAAHVARGEGGQWSVLLTCEHASNALPTLEGAAGAQQASAPPPPDALLQSHWGWDPGARRLTLALLARLAARPPPTGQQGTGQQGTGQQGTGQQGTGQQGTGPGLVGRGLGQAGGKGAAAHREGLAAVLGGCSRLLLDANRRPGSATMFRAECDGQEVAMNAGLEAWGGAAEGRVQQLHVPFHAACAAAAARAPPRAVLSLHSFTDCYEGSRRDVEVGVLVDREQALGAMLTARLREAGWDARTNEPWSAANGLMYCAERAAAPHASHALMLEVRQDLLARPSFPEHMADLLAAAFAEPAMRPFFTV